MRVSKCFIFIFALLVLNNSLSQASIASNQQIATGLSQILNRPVKELSVNQDDVRHRFQKRWYRTTFFYPTNKKPKSNLVVFFFKAQDPNQCEYEWLVGLDRKSNTVVELSAIRNSCEPIGPGSKRNLLLEELKGKNASGVFEKVNWGMVRKLYPMWSEVLDQALGRSFSALKQVKKKHIIR